MKIRWEKQNKKRNKTNIISNWDDVIYIFLRGITKAWAYRKLKFSVYAYIQIIFFRIHVIVCFLHIVLSIICLQRFDIKVRSL